MQELIARLETATEAELEQLVAELPLETIKTLERLCVLERRQRTVENRRQHLAGKQEPLVDYAKKVLGYKVILEDYRMKAKEVLELTQSEGLPVTLILSRKSPAYVIIAIFFPDKVMWAIKQPYSSGYSMRLTDIQNFADSSAKLHPNKRGSNLFSQSKKSFIREIGFLPSKDPKAAINELNRLVKYHSDQR